MNKILLNINDETGGIAACLENLEGQMTFFSHLIQDCEKYPEIAAAFLEHGEIQKQLNAVYFLFNHQLREIEECNNKINNFSSMNDN